MAISPPGWAKDATPTARGWVSPNGELLKSQRISEADIAEWNGAAPAAAPIPEAIVEVPIQEAEMLNEAAPTKSLEDMTKRELEAFGRSEYGIELDRRQSKESLIEELEIAGIPH